jgi:hypothetical protein
MKATRVLHHIAILALLLSATTWAAWGDGDATISLGTNPEPPAYVENPGGMVDIFWTIECGTTPEYVYFKLEDPTRTVILDDELYPDATGLDIERTWTVPNTGLDDGLYWVCVEYWSVELGHEAYAEVSFLVQTPSTDTGEGSWGQIKQLFLDK